MVRGKAEQGVDGLVHGVLPVSSNSWHDTPSIGKVAGHGTLYPGFRHAGQTG
jgi:hypothetical protein